jgi:hypothetical protein
VVIFTPRERTPGTQWIGGGLDSCNYKRWNQVLNSPANFSTETETAVKKSEVTIKRNYSHREDV